MDDKLQYLSKTLSRTKRKDYENYIVNAIWNRLGAERESLDLKPESQRYVKRNDKSYYLIDMYFPQLNIGIECDEPYHKFNVEGDRKREETLHDLLRGVAESDYEPIHIDVSKPYRDVERQIDGAVNKILKTARVRKSAGLLEPWQTLTPAQYFESRTKISINDDIGFSTIAETCNILFETSYSSCQRAFFVPKTLKDAGVERYRIWLPHLSLDEKPHKNWINRLSDDASWIYEKDIRVDAMPVVEETFDRITFVKTRDPLTDKTEYRFVGVFSRVDNKRSAGTYARYAWYERIETEFPLLTKNLPAER